MTIDEIKNLPKDELIIYAKNFNIWKQYDFPEYLEKKQIILEQITKYNIDLKEIMPTRTISDDIVTTSYNK